ncbi:MAG TPA: NADH-quinone oxidoreductase subunit N [Candidatus Krumholzibacteria bacterium]|nr:NADH-quinone oxidoreductase subunit N [Candidatus Krumholzibacteria bacterium]
MPMFTAEMVKLMMPLFILTGGACVLLGWSAVSTRTARAQGWFAGVVHVAALASIVSLWNADGWPMLNGMLIVDRFGLFFAGLCTISSLGTILVSGNYLARFDILRGEYYALLLLSLAGMFVLVTAYDLMSVFLGLELMSLAIYVMVGFRRRDLLANEAAMKYFLLGGFAIAFFLYGMSIMYGLLGTLNFKAIVVEVVGRGLVKSPVFLFAIALILVGFVFKVSAVPFHMWVPDVYQGAPSPITGFMAGAVKAASFAAFLRLFYMSFFPAHAQWSDIIVVLAIATMTLGNIVALVQRNVKRMLAYSSIAHAGYILVGMSALAIDNTRAASGVMFYLLVYTFMTLGAFALISAIENRTDSRGLELEDLSGLGLRRPMLGFAMAVFMFAMAGIPPTAGFFAKYYVFSAAVERGLVTLAVIGVLNSALSLYYYLRVVVYMYFRKSASEQPVHDDWGVRVVLIASVLAVLWLGLGPSGVVPGIETVLGWTGDSLERIVSLR